MFPGPRESPPRVGQARVASSSPVEARPWSRASPGRGGHNCIGGARHGYDGYKKSSSEDVHAKAWYGILLREPTISDPTSKTHQEFVSEFRVPYQVFVEFVEGCQGMRWAKTFTAPHKKRRGRPATPIEVKVLSSLYRLGSGSIPSLGLSAGCST